MFNIKGKRRTFEKKGSYINVYCIAKANSKTIVFGEIESVDIAWENDAKSVAKYKFIMKLLSDKKVILCCCHNLAQTNKDFCNRQTELSADNNNNTDKLGI